ncbi:MAG: ferredoxin [Clostridia bacterium]|nr:ferredoxin [Clostridia bacterium]
MKAHVDKSGCIACELCVETCPEVFRIGDDGLAEAYAEPDGSIKDKAVTARDNCPVAVISLED